MPVKFIGPSYESIQKWASTLKAEMIAANVPVVPGSDGLVTTISDAKQIAKRNWISSNY